MGCPDWPRCFGLLIPPTCSCELPDNYQEIFLEKRLQKVKKYTALLEKIGFSEKAIAIANDKSILQPEEFNAEKAWIEYINRLFGVLAGFFAFTFAVLAFVKKQSFTTKLMTLSGLIMLLLNAWLGSVVVATNLMPGIVTLHFLLSFLCIFFFMLAMHSSNKFQYNFQGNPGKGVWKLLFLLAMAEVLLGALARENVETLMAEGNLVSKNGRLAYEMMNFEFVVHRFLPAVIVCIPLLAFLKTRKSQPTLAHAYLAVAIIGLLQICLGAMNIVYVLPPVSQISHIVLGSILPVVLFYFNLSATTEKK